MTNAGHLDPTFGGGSGYVINPVVPGSPTGLGEYNSTVVEPDGSILVEGPITDYHSFGVAHLKADGSTDASFGSAGVATVALPAGLASVGTYPYNLPSTVLLQPDGKIVVVNVAQTGDQTPRLATIVARFDAVGHPDPTFGEDGVVTLDQAALTVPNPSMPYAVLQPDGKIVLAGSSNILGNDSANFPTQIASARLTSTGVFDASYGTNGLVTISDATQADLIYPNTLVEAAQGLGIQPDGKVVILASFYSTHRNLVASELIRLDAHGSRDATFEEGGITNTGINTPESNGLIIQPDGRILILGLGEPVQANPSDNSPPILARMTTNGSLEAELSFQPATSSNLLLHPTRFALQPDGKIVLSGYSIYAISSNPHPDIQNEFDAFRVGTDLKLDPTFGGGGVAVVTLSSPTVPPGVGQDYLIEQEVAVGPDGKSILIGSSFYTPKHALVIARLSADSAVPGDFDGDRISDPAFYLPSLGAFAFSYSASASAQVIPFGGPGPGITIPAPGDYTGSGRNEIAAYLPGLGIYAYRPSGGGPDVYTRIGTPGRGLTLPAPGDYYGTGRDDVAVYLADTGTYAIVDPTGQTSGRVIRFGTPGVGMSIPVPGDYYGTGRDDVAVYLVDQGAFAILDPTGKTAGQVIPFGGPGLGNALPMPGDYDGSGRTELAVYLPTLGLLAYRPAGGGPDVYIPFGGPGRGTALPAAGDYTGSGRTEPGVYLPGLAILAYRPTSGQADVYIPFGIPGAGQTIPVTTVVLSPFPGSGSGPRVSAFAFSVEVPGEVSGVDAVVSPTAAKKKSGGGSA